MYCVKHDKVEKGGESFNNKDNQRKRKRERERERASMYILTNQNAIKE